MIRPQRPWPCLAWLGLAALVLLLTAGAGRAGTVGLTVLHLNDLHGYVQPDRETGRGGLAKAATLIARTRSREPNVIFVVAGDLVRGTALSELTRGRFLFEALNLIGPQGLCLGNHDFGYGLAALRASLARARFPVLTSNVTSQGRPLGRPYRLFTVGPLRVALLGLTVPQDHLSAAHPGLRLEAPARTLRRLAPRLDRQADLLLVLTHLGLEADRKLARLLTDLVTAPAVIVGGHSHTLLRKPSRVGPVVVVQAGGYGRELGRLDLEIDPEGRGLVSVEGRLLALGPEIEPDPEIMARVHAFYQGPGQGLDQPVARLTEFLSREEVAFLLARAMKEAAGAALGVINLGGVRREVRPGLVSRDDLFKVFPFPDRVLKARLPAQAVARLLGRAHEPGAPSRPLVFWPRRGPGPLDPDRTCLVAGNDFVLVRLARSLGLKVRFEEVAPKVRQVLEQALAQTYPLPRAFPEVLK